MKKSDLIFSKEDHDYMKMANTLAKRGLGRVAPNPAVGCILVSGGHIIGRGWTGDGGRPHAETIALQKAELAKGATAYVTLEPCAHYGVTPPCAEALVQAGVSRVVVATTDPDPRVSGGGIKILEQAGIDVQIGLLEDEADIINEGFFNKIQKKRPLVTVKIACSKDGKIASDKGKQTWITGEIARRRGHLYRANHDAILIGIGTVQVDNPSLNCRIEGLDANSPIRIVLDTDLKIDAECKLCQTANDIPLWIMTASEDDEKRNELEKLGVKLFDVQRNLDGLLDLDNVLEVLAEKGITRVLSEGGAKLNASLIKASLIDRLLLFRSDDSVGENGVDALYDVPLDTLEQRFNLSRLDGGIVGPDQWQEFKVTTR